MSTPVKFKPKADDGRRDADSWLNPTTYSLEKALRVIHLMVHGVYDLETDDYKHSLRSACEAVGIAPGTFCGWLAGKRGREDGLAAIYHEAKRAMAYRMVEEIVEIVDNTGSDFVQVDGVWKTDRELVARSQLRVKTRMWFAEKLLSETFGDKRDDKDPSDDTPPIVFDQADLKYIGSS